jgi:hypothetical protein
VDSAEGFGVDFGAVLSTISDGGFGDTFDGDSVGASGEVSIVINL